MHFQLIYSILPVYITTILLYPYITLHLRYITMYYLVRSYAAFRTVMICLI